MLWKPNLENLLKKRRRVLLILASRVVSFMVSTCFDAIFSLFCLWGMKMGKFFCTNVVYKYYVHILCTNFVYEF